MGRRQAVSSKPADNPAKSVLELARKINGKKEEAQDSTASGTEPNEGAEKTEEQKKQEEFDKGARAYYEQKAASGDNFTGD